jgi:S-adenosylmethionine-dependent methyltransferase
LVEGGGGEAPRALAGETFEAVLCHGVLRYLDDPCPMVRALAALARPGAVISVLAKNASALAMRSALEGRYQDALATLEADRDLGRLGAVSRGDTVEGLAALFESCGIEFVQWYGVRVFTEHLGD